MNSFVTKTFKKGDLIIKEGDQGKEAFVINKGHVEVTKLSPCGDQVVIARLGPGQIFGEMCLFDNSPRSASVYALSDIELSIINKEEFLSYLEDIPVQIKIIIELLLKRLRQTSSLIALLKFETKNDPTKEHLVDEKLKDIDFPT